MLELYQLTINLVTLITLQVWESLHRVRAHACTINLYIQTLQSKSSCPSSKDGVEKVN